MFRKNFDFSYFQKENILFFLMNIIYFSGSCVFFGFIVMYLTAQGYSSVECGVINTLISVSSLIFQPIAGYITDTFITIKKYLIFAGIGAMATTFLLPLTVDHHLLAALSIMLVALFVNPSTFLADTWAVTLREQYPYIDYGKNRAGGSIGYSITSVFAGSLIAPFGYNVLFIIHVICFALFILIIAQIPSIPCRNKRSKTTPATETTEETGLSFIAVIKILIKNRAYLLFLLSAIFYYICMKALSGNVTYKILELGGNDSDMGTALAIGAIFEVPFLFIMSRCIRRFRLSYLYLFSVSSIVIRALLMAVTTTLSAFYLSQIMQACSYGVFVAVSLEIVSRIVPSQIRTTAVTFMIGMTNGLGAIIGSFVAGILIDRFGVGSMAFIMLLSGILGLLIYIVPTVITLKKAPDQVV